MSNLVVQTNVLALNSHRNLTTIGAKQAQSSARLSSGYKVNSAADDAAGLAISEKMRAQIRGLDMASKNTQDAISMMQTAEGGLDQVDAMIQRIRELTVQAANDTNDQVSGDRYKIMQEICQLATEIGEMGKRVQFNNKTLLDGNLEGVTFQVGANAGQTVNASKGFTMANLSEISSRLMTLISNSTIDNVSAGTISSAIGFINDQLTSVVNARAFFGAMQNRLTYTDASLKISSENLSAANSRIRDTDMAKEMMALTAANVLQQAGVSMLSQANQAPQSILSLLR